MNGLKRLMEKNTLKNPVVEDTGQGKTMAKVINRRRKNNVGLQLFGDEYEFLTPGQKAVVNKNLKSTYQQLGSIESSMFEKEQIKNQKILDRAMGTRR